MPTLSWRPLYFGECSVTSASIALHDLAALALTPEVFGIAAVLVSERVMPGPAVEGDAVHLAVAIVHRINYLLTWNQRHLANPNKRTHLLVVCSRLGYLAP